MAKISSKSTRTKKHLVSVVIPAFNAKEHVLLLLKSLENQSVRNFEVIIVDDGGTDGTHEAVEELIKSYPVLLRYYYLDNTDIFGAGIARNYGAKHAKGDIILFLDQDCVAEKDLIKKHIDQHKSKDVILGYFAGYKNAKKCYDFSKLKDCIQQDKSIPAIKEFRHQLFDSSTNNATWKCFASGHFSIKKAIFKEFNFDESFIQWGCEDIDLGYRIFKSGKEIHFVQECIVYNSSECLRLSKEKFLTLVESLIYMYTKYQTKELKLYCFERFYYTPLEYRESLQLIFKNDKFEIQESQTKIVIGGNCHAFVAVGYDFLDVASVIECVIPLIKSIRFDVAIIKSLKGVAFLNFRNSFYQLIRILRDNKKDINLDDIRRQSFLMGIRFLGPEQLSIDFHNKCNVACLFCPIHTPFNKGDKKKPHSLELFLVEKVLDQAYEMGVQSIRLVPDGEPLLSPDIYAILDSISKKGFALNLVTNLTMLNKKHLSLLSKIKNLSFLINFSAAKKATYQKLYSSGNAENYDSVLKALSWLSKLKYRRRMYNEFMLIHTTYIITNLNYHEISEYILLVKRLGVDHVCFKFAILYKESEGLLLSKDQIKELRKEVLKAISFADKLFLSTSLDEILRNIDDEGFQRRNDIGQHSLNLPSNHCYNGWFFGRINPQGNYYICCRSMVKIGNIYKKDLKGIFFSRQMSNILNKGSFGISLRKRMWSKCNYCYHLKANKIAKEWLDQK